MALSWATDWRARNALRRNPRRCVCMGGGSVSTLRASAHLTSCRHSTLAETTRTYPPAPRLRQIPGTRSWVAIVEGGR